MPEKPTITFDTKEFFARLNLADKVTHDAAFRAMRENGLDLERKSGELTPVDEGTLLGSGHSDTADKGGKITAEVSYNTPYAAAVHERMVPAPAPSVGSRFILGHGSMPGPTTRAKPGNEFGPAGGWYLRRPLIGKANEYWKHAADTIRSALDARGKI